MTSKKKTATPSSKAPVQTDIVLCPSVNAAAVISEYGAPFGEQSIADLAESLSESIAKVHNGDMRRCEAMLLAQAHALQTIFLNLSRRAINQEYLNNYETYLRLALKAQSQCRTTLETLATIKNPPVVFARQANIANGPQQVNNDLPNPETDIATRAEKNKFDQNELLEAKNEQWLDTRTTITSGKNYSELETVEASNRPPD